MQPFAILQGELYIVYGGQQQHHFTKEWNKRSRRRLGRGAERVSGPYIRALRAQGVATSCFRQLLFLILLCSQMRRTRDQRQAVGSERRQVDNEDKVSSTVWRRDFVKRPSGGGELKQNSQGQDPSTRERNTGKGTHALVEKAARVRANHHLEESAGDLSKEGSKSRGGVQIRGYAVVDIGVVGSGAKGEKHPKERRRKDTRKEKKEKGEKRRKGWSLGKMGIWIFLILW